MGEHEFEAAFRDWRRSRWQAVSAPYGTAALRHTHWLTVEPTGFTGAPGRWHAEAAEVVGVLPDGAVVRLAPGEELDLDGGVRLRAFERDGAFALRVIDPDAPSRTSLVGIEVYPPSRERVVTGRFAAAGDGATLDVTSVDGHESTDRLGGTIELEIDGVPLVLTVTRDDHGLSAVFADATSGGESYRFRFIRVPEPEVDGIVAVDFNRAYLPPCAFSDEYVCPLPPLGNRWPVALRSGERIATRHPLAEADATVDAEVDAA